MALDIYWAVRLLWCDNPQVHIEQITFMELLCLHYLFQKFAPECVFVGCCGKNVFMKINNRLLYNLACAARMILCDLSHVLFMKIFMKIGFCYFFLYISPNLVVTMVTRLSQ